jgi:hypothetical protein
VSNLTDFSSFFDWLDWNDDDYGLCWGLDYLFNLSFL